VPGIDLDPVRQLEQAPQRVEELAGALLRSDCEVGARRIADEERVAGQDEPRLVRARAVDRREARVLGPVPGRVDRAQHDRAELDLGAVLQRVVVVRGLGRRMDRDRHGVLEREPSVTGEVVRMRVRLDRPDDPDLAPRRLREHRLDREGWIHDRGDACFLVADQIRRAAEVVVNELLKQHDP
jgi:hypothetical protein